MLKIGHRGVADYPENTLASFEEAFVRGADGVECDIHLCKSGEPVVIHDATLKRTHGITGRVRNFTLTQLQAWNIPSLEKMIQTIAPRGIIYIEIKDRKAATAVAKLVTTYAKQFTYEKLSVIGFNLGVLKKIRRLDPNIVIGVSVHKRCTLAFVKKAAAMGCQSVNPCIDYVEENFVKAAHESKMKVVIWTANEQAQIDKAWALKVDIIISDYPDRL